MARSYKSMSTKQKIKKNQKQKNKREKNIPGNQPSPQAL